MLALETEIRQRDITGIIDLPEIAEGSSSATNVFLCPMDFPATYCMIVLGWSVPLASGDM